MKIGKTALWLGTVAPAIPLSYFLVDRGLALFLHEHEVMKHFFKFMTKFGQSEYYLVPSLIVYLACRKKERKTAEYSLLVFSSVALSGIATILVKVIVARYRPELLFTEGLYGFDWFRLGLAYHSFPSAHSTAVFSAFSAFELIWPRFRIPLFLFATLVALSRVMTTQHYLSDVIAGALIGLVTTLLLYP